MKPITIDFPAINSTTLCPVLTSNQAAGTQLLKNGTQGTDIFTGNTIYSYSFAPGVAVQPWIVNTGATSYSGVTFTFVGKDNYGNVISQTQAGPGGTANVVVPKAFHEITSITANGVVGASVSIGICATGYIDVTTDYWNKNANYTLQYSSLVDSTNGPSINTYFTAVQPNIFVNGQYQYNSDFEDSLTIIPLTNSNVMIASTDTTFPIAQTNAMISLQGIAVSAFRSTISSSSPTTSQAGTGSLTFTFLQQGGRV